MKNILSSSLLLKVIFVLSVGIIFFLSIISFRNLEKMSQSIRMVNHTYNVSLVLENIYLHVKDIETTKRNFILTKNDSLLESMNLDKKKLSNSVSKLALLVKDNPLQGKNVQELKLLLNEKNTIVNDAIKLPKSEYNNFDVAKENLLKGNWVMLNIRNKIDEMAVIENRLLKKRIEVYDRLYHNSPFINLLGFLITIILLTVSFIMLLRKLRETHTSNAKLTLAITTSNMAEQIGNYGTWQYNVDKDEFHFSENEYRLFGCADTMNHRELERIINSICPHELENMKKMAQSMEIDETLGPSTCEITAANGEPRHLRYISKLVKNKLGEKILLGVTTDITEEYLGQQNITQKNKELENAYDQILLYNKMLTFGEEVGKYANWHWNISKNTWFFSENLYRMMGVASFSFHPTIENFLNHVHPDDLDKVSGVIEEMLSEEEMPTFTYRMLRPSGEIIHVKAVARVVTDASGHKFLVGNTIDVTEEVLKNAETLQKNIELEASNRELQAFNYVASHDLQEPLRKIETFISILEEKDFFSLSPTGQQYFIRIKVSAERMRLLIADLLQFSRANKAEKVFEKADLNQLLEDACMEMSDCLEEKKAQVEAAPLPTLKVIPFQIKQLFLNLMGNSLKYAKPGIRPRVSIAYERVKLRSWEQFKFPADRVFHQITLKDNGIGFEPEYGVRIFELFSRLHKKDEIDGTGIGLAICKKIVDNHQGLIKGEGIPGQGSVFTILLPD